MVIEMMRLLSLHGVSECELIASQLCLDLLDADGDDGGGSSLKQIVLSVIRGRLPNRVTRASQPLTHFWMVQHDDLLGDHSPPPDTAEHRWTPKEKSLAVFWRSDSHSRNTSTQTRAPSPTVFARFISITSHPPSTESIRKATESLTRAQPLSAGCTEARH